ncbi:hypothetical protein GF356_11005 [candidate division GN15 bacterium]|nr:hypothetical protein [candidate division GN15 bacterium]
MANRQLNDNDIQRFLDERPSRRYPLQGVKLESTVGSREDLAAYRQLYFELGRDKVAESPEFVDRVCAKVERVARRERAANMALTFGVVAAMVGALAMGLLWLDVGASRLLTPVHAVADQFGSAANVALAWSKLGAMLMTVSSLVQEYSVMLTALAFLIVVVVGDYVVDRMRGQTRTFSV